MSSPEPSQESLAPTDPLAGWKLEETEVDLGAERVPLLLVDQDYVIDRLVEENADLELRNPYFGVVWPAAIALARELGARDGLAGRRVLDLGCGTGLLSIVAARRGARVTAIDLMPESVALTRRNAARAGVAIDVRLADVRDPECELGTFDLVVASDVLYERALVEAVLDSFERLLAAEGIALASDPTRPTAHEFAHRARRRGFTVAERATTVVDGDRTVAVRIFESSRCAAPPR
jgi:predicted nicotinamide N-methyase